MLCRISLSEGMCGPIGVDLRLKRSVSNDVPEDFVVTRAILIVLPVF